MPDVVAARALLGQALARLPDAEQRALLNALSDRFGDLACRAGATGDPAQGAAALIVSIAKLGHKRDLDEQRNDGRQGEMLAGEVLDASPAERRAYRLGFWHGVLTCAEVVQALQGGRTFPQLEAWIDQVGSWYRDVERGVDEPPPVFRWDTSG